MVLAEQKHYVMNPNDFVLFYHRVLLEKVQSFLDCVIINLYGLNIYINFYRFKSVICGSGFGTFGNGLLILKFMHL